MRSSRDPRVRGESPAAVAERKAKEAAALEKDPKMAALVSLNVEGATFARALWELSQSSSLAFVADADPPLPPNYPVQWQKLTIYEGPMPLRAMLDRLTALFKDTEWEYRESGIVVFRGPLNQARAKGSAHSETRR
jgi:hypothetical protein